MRWHVQSALVAVAVVAVLLGAGLAVRRRAERLVRTAAYHLQAHELLVEQAGGPLECVEAEGDEDFEEATERIFAAVGGREYLAYRASMHHWHLFEKYREAASRPWLPVASDPPAPELANPRLERDPTYDDRVRGRGKPWDSGFR
jgi:hypothetical protein